MTRPLALFALVALAACDRPAAPPPVAGDATAFDNGAAGQSVMQPEVAAANPPAPEVAPEPAAPLPIVATVGFARGAALDETARRTLDGLLPGVTPGATIVLRGHSDSPGSDAANLTQSRRRAMAVRDYLVGKGVPSESMEVIALGERRPAAPNANADGSDDPVGRARNRRVEIEVLPARPEAVEQGAEAISNETAAARD